MLPLSKPASLIDTPPKPDQNIELADDDPIKIGMNFEDRFIVIELDQENSTILSLPVNVAYRLALKMLEASAIMNFANSIGLNLSQEETPHE
jgi:hypothetical protein